MIRWHSRNEIYRFTNTHQLTSEKNVTRKSLCIPVIGTTHTSDHFLTGGREEVETGLTLSFSPQAFTGHSGRGNTSAATVFLEGRRDPDSLPLIALHYDGQMAVRTNCIKEGVKSGLANSTTGALIGLAAWCFAGSIGGALTWMALAGAAVGVGSGAAQGVCVYQSNGMREFAERCNQFLMDAQLKGLSADVIEQLRQCAKQANTKEKRELVRDIINVCVVCLGEEAVPLRELRAFMKSDEPPPPAYTELLAQ